MPNIQVLVKIDEVDKKLVPEHGEDEARPMKHEPDQFPEDFQVEDAYATLVKAYKIKCDKTMVNKILEYAKSTDFKINSIAGLKDRYNQIVSEEADD